MKASRVRGGIEQTILELRREEQALAGRLRVLAEEAAQTGRAEADAYRALAGLRLEALEAGEVSGRLDAAERAALGALDAKRGRLAEIEAEQARLNEARAKADETRAARAEAVDAANDRLEALEEATETRLAGMAAWQELESAAEDAAAKAEAADAKADQAEADRAEKSAAYDADPLFTYLWERHYGTSDYRADTFARFGDEKVANLIGYRAAREAYYRLNEIPRRLRDHAERLMAAAEAAGAARAAHERTALEADGVVAIEAEIAEAEKALIAAEAEIEHLAAAADALQAEAARLMDPTQDSALAGAIGGLAAALKREDLASLDREAAQTAGADDDAVVARLQTLRDEAAARIREVEAAQARQRAVAERLMELETQRRRFGRKGYGAPGGGFENGDALGQVLGGVLEGAIRGGALGDALSGGYRQPRRRRSGFGRRPQIKIGSPGRSAGRSSGGFRTGGGF